MPIEARRTFRLALTVALATVIAYGAGNPLPYIASVFAFVMSVKPAPPMGPAKLLVVSLALAVVLGTGILVAPLLDHYGFVGVVVVALGLFVSAKLSLGGEKAAVGTLLAAGLTLVSAIGVLSLAGAQTLVFALVGGVITAVVCQWAVYGLFPEDHIVTGQAPESSGEQTLRALRSVVITLPVYLFLLTNPTGNTPVMMKSIVLSQAPGGRDTGRAALELLGATCLGGVFAAVLWFWLKLAPNLWLYGLLVLLAMTVIGSQLYVRNRLNASPQFWIDVAVTTFILLGPAVADSANGKDPYQGFVFRFGLFLLVSLYAWGSVALLESLWRRRSRASVPGQSPQTLTEGTLS